MKPGFFKALAYPFKGIAFLFKHHELWKYAFFAFLTNVLVFTALLAGLWFYYGALVDLLTPDKLPAWLSWAQKALPIIVGCLVLLLAATVGLFLFTILGNMIAGPFLEVMTARALVLLGDPAPPDRSFGNALGRSIINQLLKFALFGTVQFLLLGCFLTPLGFLHPVLSGLLTVVFLALEYWDYPLEARGLMVPGRFAFVNSHVMPALGFGAMSWLVLLVPFLGYALLPAWVCAAVLLVHDLGRE
jgi:uncharacterized protein involved in cysteine biosynthesis